MKNYNSNKIDSLVSFTETNLRVDSHYQNDNFTRTNLGYQRQGNENLISTPFNRNDDLETILFKTTVLNDPEALIRNMMSVFGIKKINLLNCNLRDVNNSSKKLRIPVEISKLVNELYKKDISVLSEKIGSYCKIWNGEKIEKAKIWNIKSLKQISYL